MPCVALSWRANSSIAVEHVEGREDRALGVVLVGDRGAEEREHRVALELGDRALVAEDGPRHEVERLVDDRPSSPRGRICSARAVEPTTSTKSAVTGLRSPVSLRRAHLRDQRRGRGRGQAGVGRLVARWWPRPGPGRSSRRTARRLPTLASQRGQVRGGDSTVIGLAIVARSPHPRRGAEDGAALATVVAPREDLHAPAVDADLHPAHVVRLVRLDEDTRRPRAWPDRRRSSAGTAVRRRR